MNNFHNSEAYASFFCAIFHQKSPPGRIPTGRRFHLVLISMIALYLIKNVIASQRARWRGNPYSLSHSDDSIFKKGERIATLLRSSQ